MNRRLELVIEKDRLELVMNRRLEYALPSKQCLSIFEMNWQVHSFFPKRVEDGPNF